MRKPILIACIIFFSNINFIASENGCLDFKNLSNNTNINNSVVCDTIKSTSSIATASENNNVITYYDNTGNRVMSHYFENGIIIKKIYFNAKDQYTRITNYDNQGVIVNDNNYIPETSVKLNMTTYTNGIRDGYNSYRENGSRTYKNEYDKATGKTVVKKIYFNSKDQYTRIINYDNQGVIVNNNNYTPETSVKLNMTTYTNGIRDGYNSYRGNGSRSYKNEYDKATGKTVIKKIYFNSNDQYTRIINYNNKGTRLNNSNYNPVTGKKKNMTNYSNGIRTAYHAYNSNGVRTYKNEYDKATGKTVVKKIYFNTNGKYYRIVNYNNRGVILNNNRYNPTTGKKSNMMVYEKGKKKFYYNYNESTGGYVKSYYNTAGKKLVDVYTNKNKKVYKIKNYTKTKLKTGYTLKKVGVCNMNKNRSKNTVVDIGVDSKFTNRTYYAYTNKYGQVVNVQAAVLIYQAESYEKVVKSYNGKKTDYRYCKSQAAVKGTSSKTYDAGHIIGDFMGGAANSYNITPQHTWVNYWGGQYKMEMDFVNALKSGDLITDFDMKIYYKNSKTQTPSKYKVTYKIDGVKKTRTFNNRK